jgi:hypothetical protein
VSSIFREEALAELRNQDVPGDVLRATPRWLGRCLWLLLALCAAGVAAALTIRLPEEARGRALADDGGSSITAVLPVAFRGQVERGTSARVEFGQLRRTVSIVAVRLDPQGLFVRARLGTPLPAGAPGAGRLAVRVRGHTIFELLGG